MAVIYLPEDRRWGLMGEGIGQLIGTYVGQKLKQQDDMRVLHGISQIPEGPDKPQQVAEQFGTKGIAQLNALQRMQATQVLTGERQAQTTLAKARTQKLQDEMGPQGQEKQQLDLDAKKLRITQLQGEIAHITALNASIPDEAERKHNDNLISNLNMQLKAAEVGQQKTAGGIFGESTTPGVPEAVQSQLKLTPEQFAGAQVGYAVGGAKGAASAVGRAQTANKAATMQPGTKTLPTTEIATAGNVARQATGMTSVLDSLESDPGLTGGPGKFISQWLLKHGFATDPEFSQLSAASSQLVQQNATSGSGFVGKARVDLSRETAPSVIKGKVYGIQELNQIAHDAISQLQNRSLSYGPEYRKEGVDQAIAAMKKIADRTDTLWWTGDKKDPNTGKVIPGPHKVYYGGVEVDPTTLKPVKGGSKELSEDVKVGNYSISADDINRNARRLGMTPEAAEEYARMNLKAMGDAGSRQ